MNTRAIIYARRSTAEHQAASLDVQTDEARRFCDARGWSVVEVLVEDAVSRAEFVNRPALARLLLLAAAKPREVDVLVTRDESRLGGDMFRTGMVLQNLADADVAVWYYASGERVSFDDPTSKLMSAVRLYASELERLKIAGRTREALAHRHRAGFNVGGRVYGYDNVRVGDRTEYRINPEQAAIVREAFELHAAGVGVRGIAKALNARGVPSPHAGARGSGSWSPSCLHAMLQRERYRGVLEWGRVGAEYRGGTRVTIDRPDADVARVVRPELAIVSDDLWERAHVRSVERTGHGFGRAPAYLFTGFARCSTCKGPIHATNSKRGGKTIKVYVCGWNRSRGPTVCPVTLRRPVEEVDAAVLDWIQRNVMSPKITRAILAGVRRASEATTSAPVDAELATARASLARLEAEARRLTAALASSDDPPASIVEAIGDRERRASALRETIAGLVARERPPAPSWDAVEASVRADLDDLTRMFSEGTQGARRALQRLFDGNPVFHPTKANGPAWEVTVEVNLPGGAYLSTTPTGIEPVLPT